MLDYELSIPSKRVPPMCVAPLLAVPDGYMVPTACRSRRDHDHDRCSMLVARACRSPVFCCFFYRSTSCRSKNIGFYFVFVLLALTFSFIRFFNCRFAFFRFQVSTIELQFFKHQASSFKVSFFQVSSFVFRDSSFSPFA